MISVAALLTAAILCLSACSDPYKGFVIDPEEPEEEPGPNQPPAAYFTIAPASGTVFTTFSFDASPSIDPDDSTVDLRCRWDWNDDGSYETSFSQSKTIYKRYPVRTDTITVRMEVMDPEGLTSWCRKSLFIEPVPVEAAVQVFRIELSGNWTPAVGDNGSIYLGGGYLYSILPNGGVNWEYPETAFSSPAIGPDGTIYGATSSGSVCALDPEWGDVRWIFPAGGPVNTSPALGADGAIYFGSDDKHVYALNPDGSLNWKYETGAIVRSSPAIGSDGTVYIGSGDNRFYAFDPDGTLLWTVRAIGYYGEFHSSPAIGADGTIYVGSGDRNLYAVNPDGTLKWTCPVLGRVYSSPCIGADGTIYFGTDYHRFYAVDPSGSILWEYETESLIMSSPAVGADGTVFVGCHDGYLYAFDTGGELVKMYWQAGSGTSPAIASDGTVFVGSYAVSTGSMGLADSPWPKFRGNKHNTGRR